jgi:hypothetical protein
MRPWSGRSLPDWAIWVFTLRQNVRFLSVNRVRNGVKAGSWTPDVYQHFLGLDMLCLYGVLVYFSLITQRSVVQIHPPQPKGILHLAYVFSAPITSWIARDEYRGIMAQSTVKGFMFRDGLPELVRSIGLLVVGYLLLRWLYFRPCEKSDVDDATKTSESATGTQLP